MGTNLRLIGPNHIGLTVSVSASPGEAAGFPVTNIETGDRRRFFRGSAAAETTVTWDRGAGNTWPADTLIVPRADRLVTGGFNLVAQWSDDAAAWNDAFTAEVPLQSGDLVGPENTDYYKEFTLLTKRAWRLRLYGTPSIAAEIAGGIFLGTRYEVAANPRYERVLSVARPHRGRDLELSWGPWAEASAVALLAQLALVTPDVADSPHETIGGVAYGGRPHYLYDPTGTVLRGAGSPQLLPVLCVTPDAALTASPFSGYESGPFGVRWRELR